MRLHRLWIIAVLLSASLHDVCAAQHQNKAEVYAQINKQPSAMRWCTPQAGDDPAHIMGKSCEAYSECLGAVGLDESIDRPPFSGLTDDQIKWVGRCHQTLYNAARTNSQIKGSKATQDWIEHNVYPGTEAKPFPAPNSSPSPR
jgi:hypothetical protein